MKFKVGDKVKVRDDLEADKHYGDLRFSPIMEIYKGEIITIQDIDCRIPVSYVAEGWHWNDEMLEPPKIAVSHPDPVGDKGPAGPRFTRLIGSYDKGKDVLSDMVNHPQHYAFKYEPIDVINDWGLDFNLGNTVKYIARCERKGNKLQDLEKAKFYLEDEIRRLKENGIK